VVAVALLCGLGSTAALEVTSPDGQVTMTFEVKDFADAKACPVYQVRYRNLPIITESRLGMELSNGLLMENFKIVSQTESREDTLWKPVYGERNVIRDRYNQLIVELQEKTAPGRPRDFGRDFGRTATTHAATMCYVKQGALNGPMD